MAKLLFKLNGVPDDEAEEVREVLEHSEIDFYETSAGMWGLSFAGIWLKDESQFETAKKIVDEYQEKRYSKAVEARRVAQENGETASWLESILKHPIKYTAVILFIGVVLYLTITPFFFGHF
ncbi:hypothetical protein FLL45_09410 [Aliikangiella marina]|uniref:DUF2007 domain-containing protein n=1 Tax=Aliikangiella marina TaxID=1712262 RepID=A0A545TD57_9GAMM|nr:DUF6164 family protein [Aliikangiella marina]TQV75145.1 hypothetical protein FLL45_09410 [Aliikangiella marina]